MNLSLEVSSQAQIHLSSSNIYTHCYFLTWIQKQNILSSYFAPHFPMSYDCQGLWMVPLWSSVTFSLASPPFPLLTTYWRLLILIHALKGHLPASRIKIYFFLILETICFILCTRCREQPMLKNTIVFAVKCVNTFTNLKKKKWSSVWGLLPNNFRSDFTTNRNTKIFSFLRVFWIGGSQIS